MTSARAKASPVRVTSRHPNRPPHRAQASGPVEFRLGETFGGEVADGAVFYQSQRGRLGTIRRLDLDSGGDTVVYTAPDSRTHISELQAGGRRVAFELVSDGVRVLAMNTDGSGLEEIAHSRDYDRRDCGSMASRPRARRCTTTSWSLAGITGGAVA